MDTISDVLIGEAFWRLFVFSFAAPVVTKNLNAKIYNKLNKNLITILLLYGLKQLSQTLKTYVFNIYLFRRSFHKVLLILCHLFYPIELYQYRQDMEIDDVV